MRPTALPVAACASGRVVSGGSVRSGADPREEITDPVAFHAEGPVWSTRWGGLRWVDMLAGDVLALGRRPVNGVTSGPSRRRCARRHGGAVIGVERGFALEAADGTITPSRAVDATPGCG